MRPLWSGAITFGLVNIPVNLYSASSAHQRVDLDLLRASDHSRIRYKKVAEVDNQEVPREHIVKGYQYEKDRYVVLTDEDFKQVQISSNQTVDIREFVKLEDIDPRYFDSPYFLAPAKSGAKAYNLLRTALDQTGLAGVAKVVIRPPREHLTVIKPLDGILVLETLHFADELRDPKELQPPEAPVGRKELDMAISLVKTMEEEWQPEKYHDEYRESLMKLIDEKVRSGGKTLAAPKHAKERPDKVIDLVTLLQESIGRTEKAKGKAKAPRRTAHRKAA
ncbi:MAG TPA: Ku protein [Clostridia bacterium]|nr:Ku protein [Clostridia bacterium]